MKPHRALCLRVHADYLCRHAGACCTAGWAIPIERPTYDQVRVHFGTQARGRLFIDGGADGAAAVLGVQPGGACVFFEADRGNLCAVHRELGAESLPAACRQFPRVALHDARGTRISLSHFCPTAAGLLRSPDTHAFEIVEAPGTLTLDGDVEETDGDVEGMDARKALPPLLRPGMLTDHEGYDAWERRGIGLFARADLTAAQALGRLAAVTQSVQAWRPGGPSLRETVDREFDVASARKPDEDLEAPGGSTDHIDVARVRLALSSIPQGLARPPLVAEYRTGWPGVTRMPDEVESTVRGYLAARLFGNWVAYYGQGLHVIVEYLQVALAVVKIEVLKTEVVRMEARRHARESPSSPWQTVTKAIRSADLLLVHLSDARALSRLLGASRQG